MRANRWKRILAACVPMLPALASCEMPVSGPPDPPPAPAGYIGSAACGACHPDKATLHASHGHAAVLSRIQGVGPNFDPGNPIAGVPDPPPGLAWQDISYVIGGYSQRAVFLDRQGFVITTGTQGVDAQWNLDFQANGTTPSFAPFEADASAPKPYDFDCFRCHATGPLRVSANGGLRQGNLPGIGGTWAEDGVQCEACHGPGANHISAPSPDNITIDSSAAACGTCHARSADSTIQAGNGFIRNYQQRTELLASGGHASFDCTFCHDAHGTTKVETVLGIRNECTACHDRQNMAFHEGIIFVRGDYVERLKCESCHMPFATTSATAVTEQADGGTARIGDVRTHIFRINTVDEEYPFMFDPNGARVRTDESGRAAVTVDFVCLRCHNGRGRAFTLSAQAARVIAKGMHQPQ